MARTDNLTNYLTDVADAIREKKGTTDVIPANTFDEEIKNLPSGGGDVSEYFETTITNSTYNYFVTGKLLRKIPNLTVSDGTTSLENLFANYKGTYIPSISNTSNIKSMRYMFSDCGYITSLSLAFDTSNCFDFDNFCYNCSNLESISLPGTPSATSMHNMFAGCTKLKTISGINTSNVESIGGMFNGCQSLEEIPSIDTSKATNMSYMFQNCNKLKNIPSSINTFSVTNISNMFSGCWALTSIQELNASNINNIFYAFSSCINLQNFGGLKNLGQAYQTTASANNFNYTLDLSGCTNLTHDSLMNVINNLYDIASAGVQPQKLQLGSDNLARITDEEKAIATNKGWSLS